MQGEQGEAKTPFGKQTESLMLAGGMPCLITFIVWFFIVVSLCVCLFLLFFSFFFVLQHDYEVVLSLLCHGHREVFFHAGVL